MKKWKLYRRKSEICGIINRSSFYQSMLKSLFGDDCQEGTQKFAESLKTIDGMKESFEKYHHLYEEQIKPYQAYIAKAKEWKNLRMNSHPKYINRFITDIYEYLDESDQTFYHDNINHFQDEIQAPRHLQQMKCYPLFFNGYLNEISFQSPGLIDAFSSASEETLNNPNAKDFCKQSIIKDRIAYFEELGYDFGDNYDEYITNPEIVSKIPSTEVADSIIEVKEGIYKSMVIHYMQGLSMFEDIQNALTSYDFIGKDIMFSFKDLLEKHWQVRGNYIRIDSKDNSGNIIDISGNLLKFHPLVIICADKPADALEHYIIHELNHLCEMQHLGYEINDDTINLYGENGWDLSTVPFVSALQHHKYTMSNEVINDLLADDIVKFMHQHGIYLFGAKATSQWKNDTVYQYGKVLMGDFYQSYNHEIRHARLTGNKGPLFSKVGEDNFERLNDLVNQFYIYFGCAHGNCLNIDKTLQDTEQNIVTDDTIKHSYFINGSAQILETMQEHQQKHMGNGKR